MERFQRLVKEDADDLEAQVGRRWWLALWSTARQDLAARATGGCAGVFWGGKGQRERLFSTEER
jgi:hypothetical protein